MIRNVSSPATPAGVVDALQYYPARTVTGMRTVTVVDATRFEAPHEVLTPLIEPQIAGADLLVVTKSDEAIAIEVEHTARVAGRLAPAIPLHVVDATSEETLALLLRDLVPEGVHA